MVSISHVMLSLFFALWLLRIYYMDVNDGLARRREQSIRTRRNELHFLDKRSKTRRDLIITDTGGKWFALEQVLNPTESQSVFAIPKQSAVTCLSECMLDLTLHGYCIVDPEMLKDRLGRWNVKRKFNQGVFHDEPFRVKSMDYRFKNEITGAATMIHQDKAGKSLRLWIPKFSSKHLVVMSSLTKKLVMNADNMAVFFWTCAYLSFDGAEYTEFPQTWHAGFIDKNDADHATVDSSINCETWDVILEKKIKFF